MKKLGLIAGLLLMIGGIALAVNYGEYPAQGAKGFGIAYSPVNFTAQIEQASTREAFPTSRLTLSGGLVSSFTTAECSQVVVFRNGSSNPAAIYTPTSHQFIYLQPTLEVVGAYFTSQDTFRVEFLTGMSAANTARTTSTLVLPVQLIGGSGEVETATGVISYDYMKTVQPMTMETVTFPSSTKSLWVKNDSATNDVWVNWAGNATTTVLITTDGYSMLLKSGEDQVRDIRTTAIRMLARTATVEVRVGGIL